MTDIHKLSNELTKLDGVVCVLSLPDETTPQEFVDHLEADELITRLWWANMFSKRVFISAKDKKHRDFWSETASFIELRLVQENMITVQ